jgi:hypothetical protein
VNVAFLVAARVRSVAVPGKHRGDALWMPELAMTPAGWLLKETGPFEISDQLAKLPWHLIVVSH